jgi:hypothetical protein
VRIVDLKTATVRRRRDTRRDVDVVHKRT